jgi:hypothetical protein
MDRFHRVCLTSTVAIALCAGPLFAQEAPAPAPAEPAPVAAEPAPAPAAEPAPVAEPARAPEEAAAAPAVEEAPSVPSWVRIDSDGYGVQLWAGATHDLGAFQLATDIYVASGTPGAPPGSYGAFSIGEFDIGPAFTFADGKVALTPMVGAQFDWVQKRMVSLVAPQLFTILNFDSIYFESWIQLFVYSPFTDGAEAFDTLYTRDFLLYKVSDMFAIGPNIELNYGLDAGEITSLPIGGAAMVGYGTGNTLLLALGYETNEDARAAGGGSGDRAIAGRFTFIHYF